MPTLRLERRILADPTSTALQLAGPAGIDLWPGSRRLGESDGRVIVESAAPAGVAEVSVQAWPPRRTPVAFVVRFRADAVSGAPLPSADGVLTLRYDSAQSTAAELVLDLDADEPTLAWVTGVAGEFLGNLAAAAEGRTAA